MKFVIALALVATASAGFLDAQHEHIVSMPMHQYKQDCGTQTHLRFNPDAPAFLQHENVPGAGVDKFTPFKTVLKDGFLEVDCVKDYMYYRGDKFGDNKHDYKLGPVSDVSIVHYAAHVKKEDQVEMTQKVCFEFCRTVPNMGFFGIVNGRGCYCTPYFTSMESDSSQCDAVCEGETTLMCGGKSKSSVFAMHMCDSTADDVSARSGAAGSLKASMDSKVTAAKGLSSDLQSAGEALQKSFGAVGDSGAAGLAQNAKVFAGTLEHKAEDADAVAGKLGDLVKAAVAFILAATASAGFLDTQHEHIVSMPMHQFKSDCGTQSTLRWDPNAPSFLQNVPGAGVDAFKPYKTVLKDGFLEVDCIKDYM